MKKIVSVVLALALLLGISSTVFAGGFDQYGYNDVAGVFNGPADGVDRVMDSQVWGDPIYANDHLVMKWNQEWIRGKTENWSKPPYSAWESNEWNGAFPGGSGEVWHYKIVWVGPCTEGAILPEGGYCIWGQFEVIMDQGTYHDGGAMHLWLAHASPTGYGAYGN